jgi:hypothetical protein
VVLTERGGPSRITDYFKASGALEKAAAMALRPALLFG